MNSTNPSDVEVIDRFSCDLASKTPILWSAILIGALAEIGLSFLLNLFNVSIGLTVISTNAMGNETFAIGSLAGLLLGVIAIMFFSGWLTGYIARSFCKKINGGIYGFSAWCLALLITILTASYVGKFITSSFYSLSHSSPISQVMANSHNNVFALAPALSAPNQPGMDNNVKIINITGVSTFIIFILFFVGALSSTMGGYCGSSVRKDCEF